MIETSKQLSVRFLALAALALAACNSDAAGQIPCVEDVSCPHDYPVCGPAGKCIAGTSTANASVAIVGAEGHTAADFLSGTVRVLVSARASTGVQSVSLASGTTTFTASATAAAPPLYAFDVNTSTLADGDAPLTATLTAGDGSTGSASGTLHVDNAKPAINAFSLTGGVATAGTVTSGKTISLTASFTGGTGTITAGAAGSISVTSGASVLVSPDVQTTYKLVVTSRSGVTSSTGAAPHPDVTVSVVGPASFTGTATVSPSAIQQGPGVGNFTFTAPAFGASVVAADVKDSTNAVVGTIASSAGTALVPVPDTTAGTTQLTYTLVLRNAATTPDTVSFPLAVSVGSPPVISTFTGSTTITSGASAPLQATFTGGNGIITPGNIPILSGGTAVVAPTSTTTYRLTVTNPTTSAAVSSGTTPPDVTVTVVPPPAVTSFVPSSVHVSSGDPGLTFSIASTGVVGNASVTGSCSPAATVTPFTITLVAGAGTSAAQTAPTVNGTSTCTYRATVQNGPGTQDVAMAVVTVEPLPTITSFQFQTTGTQNAFFALHDDVILTHVYDAHGGTATINGVPAGGATTTFTDLRIDTVYTLTVTNLAGKPVVSAPATASIAPGSWSELNNGPFEPRSGVTVTALANGKVLIAGGTNATGDPLDSAVVCDATGACAATGQMKSPRAFHTATLIPSAAPNNGGKVLLAGGYKGPGLTTPTTTAELYDPAANTWAFTTDIKTASVPSARARHVAVLLDSRNILFAGGTDGAADLDSATEYDAGAVSPAASDVAPPRHMAHTRASFTGTLLATGGKVLIVGGNTGNDTAELFDPAGKTFSDTAEVSTTSLEDKRFHTAVLIDPSSVVNGGKVLISGGVTSGQSPSSTQFLYTPPNGPTPGSFAPTGALRVGRSHHAAIALSNYQVLICGGTDGTTLNKCERYHPDTETSFPTAPMLLGRQDFGLAPITISSLAEQIASGGTDASVMNVAEAYDLNAD